MLARTTLTEPNLAARPIDIFRLLAERGQQGGALVTITGLTGPSARAAGQHMAVLEDGSFAGSFSGSCLDAAIVAEAREAIAASAARQVRYGEGSPYIDIRLPCGGGMDLLFQPNPPAQAMEQAAHLLEQRSPLALRLAGNTITLAPHQTSQGWHAGAFIALHQPHLRLCVVGQGAEALVLARLAQAYGASLDLLTPDEALGATFQAEGTEARLIRTASTDAAIAADHWTAIVLLFHDHDWEIPLLRAALGTDAFWIGAMGGAQTRERRREALMAAGVPPGDLHRIRGPIGLIPAARDPATLALSALAEIAAAYRGLAS
jgi:xanthine dehydrogenase accessory factor